MGASLARTVVLIGLIVPGIAAGASVPDQTFDSGSAPDVTSATVNYEAAQGRIAGIVQLRSTSDLIAGQRVTSFLDTDGRAETGDPAHDGADRYIALVGEASGPVCSAVSPQPCLSDRVEFGRYSGGWLLAPASSLVVGQQPGQFYFYLGAVDAGLALQGETLRARVEASFAGPGGVETDLAPNGGQPPLSVILPGVPAAPSAPPVTTRAPAAAPIVTVDARCARLPIIIKRTTAKMKIAQRASKKAATAQARKAATVRLRQLARKRAGYQAAFRTICRPAR